MANSTLDMTERARRKALVEDCLRDGFAPIGVSGSKGSALEEACRRDCRITGFFARWLRIEEMYAQHGRPAFVPDFSLFVPAPDAAAPASAPARPRRVPALTEPKVDKSAMEIAQDRADALNADICALLTDSRYPVENPEAIVVDAAVVRKFSAKEGEYIDVPAKPRTSITETLRVAGIDDPRGLKFLFTGAQNDADVHPELWANFQAYADFIDAELVAGPSTYETQWWSENNPLARAYDPIIADHLCFGQMKIGDNFVFCGEMNTLQTASAPISDLVTYSRGRWAVFPHPKRQLKSVPSTDPDEQAHQVMTTGYVTKPKVIPRKAGIKSIFHHVYGAVIVEFDSDGDLFCRQITADNDGSFYDLDRHVADGKVTTGHRIESLVCGDIHLRKINRINALATFGFDPLGSKSSYRNSVVETLKPKHIFLHDIFDNEARNHHNCGDNAYSYEMAIRGRDKVIDEITEVAIFLDRLQDESRDVCVVESNHDLGLERYVREGRYRNDGHNVRVGLKLEDLYLSFREEQAKALDAGVKPPSYSLLEEAVRMIEPLPGVSWVHDGKSRTIDDIEHGHHFFRGANGAKGTVAGFARMGRKMSGGDKHSPEINEGVYVAGCMELQHGYNKGPSSWAVAHIVQYPNGKRSIITLQKGKWNGDCGKPRIAMAAA